MAHTTVGVTRLLYQEQGDLHRHEAIIKSIEELAVLGDQSAENGRGSHIILLDETIFHVRGGGQPFDIGQLTGVEGSQSVTFDVKAVNQEEGDRISHTGTFLGDNASTFKPGDKVKLSIDVDRRTLNSRLHSAGHILGVATMQLSREGKLPELVETKASHYPDAAGVEFQGLIDGKHKDAIQQRTDELVQKALPLTIHFWDRQECAANGITQLPEKVGADNEQKVFRTVLIEGQGAYPCGGTHVADTSGVGRIIVRRISRQKGTSKISYTVA